MSANLENKATRGDLAPKVLDRAVHYSFAQFTIVKEPTQVPIEKENPDPVCFLDELDTVNYNEANMNMSQNQNFRKGPFFD